MKKTSAHHELTPADALKVMREVLDHMRSETDRNQLSHMTPDDAFEAGFEYALGAFESLTGPDPSGALARIREQITTLEEN